MCDRIYRYPEYGEILRLNFLTVAGKKEGRKRGEGKERREEGGRERGTGGNRGERGEHTYRILHFKTKNMPGAYMKIALNLNFLD